MGDSIKHHVALAGVTEKSCRDKALVQKARRAVLVSRLWLVAYCILFTMVILAIFNSNSFESHDLNSGMSPGEMRARVYYNLGEGIFVLLITAAALFCFWLTMRFARKWARLASEALATSEVENRRILQLIRSSEIPFALFLRGFEEEGKAFQSMFSVPISTKRPDRATRWIESEIVDQLKNQDMETFCIANPSDTFLLPGAIRLLADPAAWRLEVSSLARDSELIIIYLSATSKGLQIELDLLREQSLLDRTILVASSQLLAHYGNLEKDFPLIVTSPSIHIANQSSFGPIFGKNRFRRDLRLAIDKAVQSTLVRSSASAESHR